MDSWIWSVRLAKTRSLASAACRAGHVRVNDERVKPAQMVKVGDKVRVRQEGLGADRGGRQAGAQAGRRDGGHRVLRRPQPAAAEPRGPGRGGPATAAPAVRPARAAQYRRPRTAPAEPSFRFRSGGRTPRRTAPTSPRLASGRQAGLPYVGEVPGLIRLLPWEPDAPVDGDAAGGTVGDVRGQDKEGNDDRTAPGDRLELQPRCRFEDRILAEADRLRGRGVLRLLDIVLVAKSHDGMIERLTIGDDHDFGSLLAAIVPVATAESSGGAGIADSSAAFDRADAWALADSLEPGTALAFLLVEHYWAAPLFDAIAETGGTLIGEGFFTAETGWWWKPRSPPSRRRPR